MTILVEDAVDFDATLRKITKAVLDKLGGKIIDFAISQIDGVIILSGKTSSFYLKQLASHAALGAVDQVPISNRIEVN